MRKSGAPTRSRNRTTRRRCRVIRSSSFGTSTVRFVLSKTAAVTAATSSSGSPASAGGASCAPTTTGSTTPRESCAPPPTFATEPLEGSGLGCCLRAQDDTSFTVNMRAAACRGCRGTRICLGAFSSAPSTPLRLRQSGTQTDAHVRRRAARAPARYRFPAPWGSADGIGIRSGDSRLTGSPPR